MSLEEAIKANTKALEENTAALKAGGGKSGGGGGGGGGVSIEQMQVALGKVKEMHGAPAAKAIIKNVGKADQMVDITDSDVVQKVYAAAQEKLKEPKGGGDEL